MSTRFENQTGRELQTKISAILADILEYAGSDGAYSGIHQKIVQVYSGDAALEAECHAMLQRFSNEEAIWHSLVSHLSNEGLLNANILSRISIEDLMNFIILEFGRPVYAVINNSIIFDDNSDFRSRVWMGRIEAHRRGIESNLPSVGKIYVRHHDRKSWVGTGWFIDDDIIVTNMHVVREFANILTGKFLTGVNASRMTAHIDMIQQEGSTAQQVFAIEEVVYASQQERPDIAFLRVRKSDHDAFPRKIDLESFREPQPGDQVVTIGYPGWPESGIYDEITDRIFRRVYGKKRVSPGKLSACTHDVLYHNCSTLGGYSGAVVLDLETHQAVGLHFGGWPFKSNYAVPVKLVKKVYDAL